MDGGREKGMEGQTRLVCLVEKKYLLGPWAPPRKMEIRWFRSARTALPKEEAGGTGKRDKWDKNKCIFKKKQNKKKKKKKSHANNTR